LRAASTCVLALLFDLGESLLFALAPGAPLRPAAPDAAALRLFPIVGLERGRLRMRASSTTVACTATGWQRLAALT
jgi:hypothetical protein